MEEEMSVDTKEKVLSICIYSFKVNFLVFYQLAL